ncbi:MAG TPA: aminotransferase class V-fold PLP-dependent enzyme [Rhodothermales bacterium]|nr:aminotransferase class V-fold PLP-dependent enzyme [Rhodothermales bacterium]
MTLDELRAHFPHIGQTIYLNHAATSPLSRPVMEAVEKYLKERHRTNIENYFDFAPVLAATRARIARLLGTEVARVEFMPNTSYGLNVLAMGLDWQAGDRVAVPGCEFPANVFPFLNLRQRGVETDFIPHHDGVITLDDIAATLQPTTRLLTVSWVQFLSGFRCDLEAIGHLCRERGVLFCVDAIQGLGALQLDVEACGIDFLACGGHKWLMATQGIGFLYLTEALQERITPMAGWLHGPVDWDNLNAYDLSFHPDATRFRLGTLNSVGIAALHAALGLYFEAGPAWCEAQVLARSRQVAEGLSDLGLKRYGSDDPTQASGIITVKHPNAEGVLAYLKERDITAAVRNQMLRFAPTYYNTPDEITQTLDVVRQFDRTQVATS